jgi:hypothetical protein
LIGMERGGSIFAAPDTIDRQVRLGLQDLAAFKHGLDARDVYGLYTAYPRPNVGSPLNASVVAKLIPKWSL